MRKYEESELMLERALRLIPAGTQTFSKSVTQYPRGVSPLFIQRGEGSKVWDIDGNEFLDFSNGLATILLGYNDPDVREVVERQLRDGVIFSLPHPIEVECAEAVIGMVPCAEMVRFGKNGSDATAGTVRLARAWNRRDHVIVCGYHGWQDWYIGSTSRNLGVPTATQALTHPVPYNDLDAVNQVFAAHRDDVAALILEPMSTTWPSPDYLDELKALVHANGAVLIFDEVVTGFRFAPGGAQEYFGTVPDLCALGKGLANGYPLSAVAGPEKIMRLMEEVFFSFTMGGEALSLAAAKATLTKIRTEPVVETLAKRGQKVAEGVQDRIRHYGLDGFLKITGHPAWSFLVIDDAEGYDSFEIKTLFLQEMFERGILTTGSHNMSYAHSEEDVVKLLAAYDEVFAILRDAIRERRIAQLLRCDPLKPLFEVRRPSNPPWH